MNDGRTKVIAAGLLVAALYAAIPTASAAELPPRSAERASTAATTASATTKAIESSDHTAIRAKCIMLIPVGGGSYSPSSSWSA